MTKKELIAKFGPEAAGDIIERKTADSIVVELF